MVAEALVRSEIRAGIDLIRVLDSAGFGVNAAFWFYSTDSDRWRFVVATTVGPKDIQAKYLEAAGIVARHHEKEPAALILPLDRVKITDVNDPLVTGLKAKIRVDGIGEVRFANNLVNGIYVEDALIHRMAA